MIHTNINGFDLEFRTSEQLFSPRSIDRGTLAMLSVAEFEKGDKVLDLGCGYGVVGILAARIVGPENVVMIDSNEKAIELSLENAVRNDVEAVKILLSDGFKALDEKDFTVILCNPPYHVDFSVPKMFIEKGFNRLAIGGRMLLVTKRRKWYQNKLTAIFGGVKTRAIDDYWVFVSIKKSGSYANVRKARSDSSHGRR